MAKNDGDWFPPKQFGYGAGLPISWQGWLALAIYLAVVGGAAFALRPRHLVPFIVIAVLATLVFAVVCAQHTRGGWKWRWGGRD